VQVALTLFAFAVTIPSTDRQSNLAYQAAELIAQFSNALAQYGGVEITIHKRIPVAAGLAAGVLQMRQQSW